LKQLIYQVNWRALDRLLSFLSWMVALALMVVIAAHSVHLPRACHVRPAPGSATGAPRHAFQISDRSPLLARGCAP
jgi:hypothetical protein